MRRRGSATGGFPGFYPAVRIDHGLISRAGGRTGSGAHARQRFFHCTRLRGRGGKAPTAAGNAGAAEWANGESRRSGLVAAEISQLQPVDGTVTV